MKRIHNGKLIKTFLALIMIICCSFIANSLCSQVALGNQNKNHVHSHCVNHNKNNPCAAAVYDDSDDDSGFDLGVPQNGMDKVEIYCVIDTLYKFEEGQYLFSGLKADNAILSNYKNDVLAYIAMRSNVFSHVAIVKNGQKICSNNVLKGNLLTL